MYIFYKIYLQRIYWTLFFIARYSTIFASELPEQSKQMLVMMDSNALDTIGDMKFPS
jgi:hypothetical protein